MFNITSFVMFNAHVGEHRGQLNTVRAIVGKVEPRKAAKTGSKIFEKKSEVYDGSSIQGNHAMYDPHSERLRADVDL